VSNYSGSGNVISTGGTGGTGGTGVSSQWTTTGVKIYYSSGTSGNSGVGTIDPIAPLHIYNNAITATLPTEIVVAGTTSGIISGTTDRYISFPYTSDSAGLTGQTQYTFTTTENLICDILMIGGGGGGGADRAGGGGSGALILSIDNILSGTYTIRVGNGGDGDASLLTNGKNGFDSEIVNSGETVIFRAKGGGGGSSIGSSLISANNGGSGGGARSQNGGLGGIPVTTNIVNGITTGPIVTTTYGVYGNRGGRNITDYTGNFDNMDGAGGGGIGEGGSTSGALQIVDSQFVANDGGKGGDGLYFATINGVVYNFKNDFNVNGIQDGTTGNYFIGGGGGGGDTNAGIAGIGGKGGGGKGGEFNENGVSASGFGSGGGGGR
jgi:hypothetical protein